MARLEDVLPAYREGKQIQLKTKSGVHTITRTGYDMLATFSEGHLLSDQWSIVEEPITITREQLERAWMNMPYEGHGWGVDDLWAELKK